MIEVIDAISNRLYDTFGPDYAIYLDQSKQEFESPAFFITIVNFDVNDYIMGSRRLTINFDVLYYPEHEHDRHELITMMGSMKNAFDTDLPMNESLNTMENVPVFDKQMRIVDDVLHFLFRLDFYTDVSEEEIDKMLKLTKNIGVETDG